MGCFKTVFIGMTFYLTSTMVGECFFLFSQFFSAPEGNLLSDEHCDDQLGIYATLIFNEKYFCSTGML